jgi:predicted dehydrogenase
MNLGKIIFIHTFQIKSIKMNSNRRSFIKTTALATAAFGAFPAILKAGSANEKIVVGLVGCNGMGFSNLKAFLKQANVECAALCDVDRNVLEERAAEVEKIQGKKPILYNDFRELLDNKDIDAVINGTPDHWHALVGIYAMEAGKDLYTEKPLANSIQECNLMVAAQKRYNKVVQVGQWQRSDPHWKAAVDYLHAGNIGRIRSVRAWSYVGWKGSIPVLPDSEVPAGVDYDFWLGPAPKRPFNQNRFHFTFRWYWDYAGGLLADWGVHLLDYALFGMNQYVPKSVMATGGKYAFPFDAMETPDTCMAVYDFGDFGVLWDHTIGIYGANFNRGHGVAFVGEWGTLVIDRNGWEVIPETTSTSAKNGYKGMPLQKGTGQGLNLHVANFLDCIKTGYKPNCDIEIGAHIARISHLGNISYRLNRKVFWDPEIQEFINDKEANEMVKAFYRAPWELPKV